MESDIQLNMIVSKTSKAQILFVLSLVQGIVNYIIFILKEQLVGLLMVDVLITTTGQELEEEGEPITMITLLEDWMKLEQKWLRIQQELGTVLLSIWN